MFKLQDPENRIREVQLVYRKVVPRPFDPPESWNLIPDGIYFLRGGGSDMWPHSPNVL